MIACQTVMHALLKASEALDNYTTELNMNRSQVFNTRAQRCHDPKAKEILCMHVVAYGESMEKATKMPNKTL